MFSSRRILANCLINTTIVRNIMKLQEVVSRLNKFAPPSLAGSWDNVGLLLEPSHPHDVNTIILTNDLTVPVLEEALEKKADMIISYHPPIFSAVKKITNSHWKNRIIVKCLENRIAVYSPHTCYDALQGGVNDWLASAFTGSCVEPIEQSMGNGGSHKISLVSSDGESLQKVTDDLSKKSTGVKIVFLEGKNGGDGSYVCAVYCNSNTVSQCLQTISRLQLTDTVTVQEVIKLEQLPLVGYGMGRVCKLDQHLSVSQVVETIKSHLQLQHVRVALGENRTLDSKVKSVALCAGSGASVLKGNHSDVYWSGEMSHHEVLDAVAQGITVVLCEHSNTERGFLTTLRPTLESLLDGSVVITVSEKDRDPLQIM